LAREAERQRQELETNWNHVERRTMPPTFERASSAWLAVEKLRLAKRTYEIYEVAVRCHLVPALGPRLLWGRCQRIIIRPGETPPGQSNRGVQHGVQP
jgi:hypothetical protein